MLELREITNIIITGIKRNMKDTEMASGVEGRIGGRRNAEQGGVVCDARVVMRTSAGHIPVVSTPICATCLSIYNIILQYYI